MYNWRLILLLLIFARSVEVKAQRFSWLEIHSHNEPIKDGLKKYYKNGLTGYLDAQNNVVIDAQYMNGQDFSDGYAIVTNLNAEKLIIDKKNKVQSVVTRPLKSNFNEGLVAVFDYIGDDENQSGYMNPKGEMVIYCNCMNPNDFNNGYAQITEEHGDKQNLINHKGEPIFPWGKYEGIAVIAPKLIRVWRKGLNFAGLIDEKENIILPFQYENILYDEIGQCLMAIAKGKIQIFDLKGKLLLKDSLDEAYRFNKNGMMVVSQNEKYGVLNRQFKYQIPMMYSSIVNINDPKYFFVKKDDLFYVVDMQHKLVDSVGYEMVSPRDFSDGMWVMKNQKVGIVSRKDFHTIIPIEYDAIAELPQNAQLLMRAQKNGKIGYIDAQNKTIIPFEYDPFDSENVYYQRISEDVNPQYLTSNAAAIMYKDGKCGLVDFSTQKILLPFEYGILFHTSEEKRFLFGQNNFVGLVDIDNNVILPAEYEQIKLSNNGCYVLQKYQKRAIASADGKKISRFYDRIQRVQNGYVVTLNKIAGILNDDLEEVVPPSYTWDQVVKWNEDDPKIQYMNLVLLGSEAYKYQLFDMKGQNLTPDLMLSGGSLNGIFVARSTEGVGAVDTLGHWVIPPMYSNIAVHGKGFIAQNLQGSYGVIDAQNKIIHPFIYRDLASRKDKILFVKEDRNLSILNKDLKFEFPFIYNHIELKGNLYFVRKGNFMGVLDINKNIVIPFEYDEIEKCNNNFIVFKNKKAALVSAKNKIIIPFEYDSLIDYDTYIVADKNGKKGLILNNKLIVPCEYDMFNLYDKNTYQWIKASKNKKWGYINTENKVMIPFRFNESIEQLGAETFRIDEGYRKLGLIDNKGNQILAPEYEFIGRTENGRTLIKKDGKNGFLTKEGNIYFEGELELKRYNVFDEYSLSSIGDTIMAVRRGSKWGLQSETGRVVLEPTYQSIALSENRKDWVVTQNGQQGIMNDAAKITTDFGVNQYKIFDVARYQNEVMSDTAFHFIHDNEFTLSNKTMLAENRVPFGKGNKCGYMNMKGKIVIPAIYDYVGTFNNGLAPVSQQKRYGYVDSTGELVINLFLAGAHNLFNDRAIVKKDGKFGAMNSNGKLVIPFQYIELNDFFNASYSVCKGQYLDPLQFIDAEGNLLGADAMGYNPREYTYKENRIYDYYYSDYPKPVYVADKVNKYKYVNENQEDAMPMQFDRAEKFYEGFAEVTLANKKGYINTKGEPITGFIFDSTTPFKNGIALVKRAEKYYYINTKGQHAFGLIK